MPPIPRSPPMLRGDPGRLRQILANLVGNAVKFTQKGEVAVRVSLDEETETECLLRFSVRDTGIGIPEDKLGVLFGKFSQVDASTTRKYGGTGLGLAISKQLAELMGGEIGVESEEGRGSEFWFTARLGKQAGKAPVESRPPAARRVEEMGVTARILLAEDNITNQQVALGILKKLGLRADAVANGAEAVKALESIPYDLVLMDVQMPVMDGLEATRQIRNPQVGRAQSRDSHHRHDRPRHAARPGALSGGGHERLCVQTGFTAGPRRGPGALAAEEEPGRLSRKGESAMRILIAEDDRTSRTVLAGVLTKEGHQVEATVNGAEAWEALRQPGAPALAILDWAMPEMDGLDVVRRVRALQTDRPPYILMLTTRGEKADIIAGLEAGANDYLSKPFDPGELRARIEVGRRMVEMQAALVASRETLAHRASHDPLTGMLSRRAILEKLEEELARAGRHGDLLAVGMCDIDHFKQVNDTYGHQTGDDVLGGLARILNEGLRPYDSAGRVGGEEFLVIAPMKARTDFLTLFDRLCLQVAESKMTTRSGVLSVTLSIGVACAGAGSTADQILEAADAALYRAKNEGRNRVAHDMRCIPEGRPEEGSGRKPRPAG